MKFVINNSGDVGIGKKPALDLTSGATILATGAAQFTSLSGAGLTYCSGQYDKLLWNSATKQFSCGADRSSYLSAKTSNQTTGSTTLQNVTSLALPVGANENWIFFANLAMQDPGPAEYKIAITTPSGATCEYSTSNESNSDNSDGEDPCNGVGSEWLSAGATSGDDFLLNGYIANGSTPGNVQVQASEFTASGTLTFYGPPSFIIGYKVSGADIAEIYYTKDSQIQAADVVAIDPTMPAGIKKTSVAYDKNALGVISTKPGQILAGADGSGIPQPMALAGRVPVKVTSEGGEINVGDYLTTSSVPGYAMRATHGGQMIGKALTPLDTTHMSPCGENKNYLCGEVLMFVNNSYIPYYNPDIQISSNGDLVISPDVNSSASADFTIPQDYKVTDLKGSTVEDIGSFAQAVIGNIKSGAVQSQQVITDSLAINSTNISIAGKSLDEYIASVSAGVIPSQQSKQNNDLASKVDALTKQMEILQQSVKLATESAFLNDSINSPLFNASGAASLADQLNGLSFSINNATISGNLNVLGRTVVNDLGVTGNITTGILGINGLKWRNRYCWRAT